MSPIVRSVFAKDLKGEFATISRCIHKFPVISFDTEFPGSVYPSSQNLSPEDSYKLMKKNVDATNLIQLGLTLSNSKGEILTIGNRSFIWEFNFKDFDLARGDIHNQESIELLKKQGIDFERNRKEGIESSEFVKCMINSKLVLSPATASLTWIGFQCSYDFGYLMKILTGAELPNELPKFLKLVDVYFGARFYDLKHMMKHCSGLFGGLERLASSLDVDRVAGKSHLAGSDSLLTSMTFTEMRKKFFDASKLKECCGMLHGIEKLRESNVPPSPFSYSHQPIFYPQPPPTCYLHRPPPQLFVHHNSQEFQVSAFGYHNRCCDSMHVMAISS